jgi:hypothetical protein
MASAVVAAILLTVLMPDDVQLGPNWLLPLVEGVLIVALVASDPGTIDRPLRALSIGWSPYCCLTRCGRRFC